MATTELTFKVNVDQAAAQAEMRRLQQTVASTVGTAQKNIATGSKEAAAGTKLFQESINGLTASLNQLGGPLGNISTRLSGITSVAGDVTSGTISMSGAFTIFATVAAANVVGVAALHQGLFQLATDAAKFRGELFDLSQQTGVNVETLSTLEVAAATTGGNIQTITQSLFNFQRQLDAAQDSTSKQAELFKSLGIETNNTEEAFRQALTAINKMPEGFKQTNAAAELFGARGGKQVLAILKELDGDLDTATKRFREMGIIVSGPAAKAADDFNDQLTLVQFELRALGAEIGERVMPLVLNVVREFSRVLRENKQAIDAVATGAAILATVLSENLVVAFRVAGVGAAFLEQQLRPLLIILQTIEGFTKGGAFAGVTGGVGSAQASAVGGEAGAGAGVFRRRTGGGGGGGGGRGGGGKAKKADDDTGFLGRLITDAANEALDKHIKLLEDLGDLQARLTKEVERATQADKTHLTLTNEFIASLEKQGLVIDANTKFWLRMNASIVTSHETLKKFIETFEAHAEALGQIAPGAQGIGGTGGIGASVEDEIARAAGAAADAVAGPPPALQAHVDMVGTLRGAYEGLAGAIAEGTAQMIHNFILMGNAGDASFRKIVASALASLAARAAADAIYELAIGFAALTPWGAAIYGPAVLHFKAAALLAGIALTAGVAGRAVAGNTFQQKAGSGGGVSGGGGGGGGGTPTTNERDRTIREARRGGREEGSGAGAMMGQIEVTLKYPDGFAEQQMVRIYDRNGSLRGKIRSDILEEANG